MSFTSNKIAVLQFETQLSYTCLYLNASFFRNSGSSSNEYDNPESAITRRLLLIDTSMLKTFLAHFIACLNLYSSLASSLGKSCTKKACLKCSVSFIFSSNLLSGSQKAKGQPLTDHLRRFVDPGSYLSLYTQSHH